MLFKEERKILSLYAASINDAIAKNTSPLLIGMHGGGQHGGPPPPGGGGGGGGGKAEANSKFPSKNNAVNVTSSEIFCNLLFI